MRRIIHYSLAIVILLGLILAGYFYYEHNKLYPSTDDAYVQAHVVHVAAQVSGKVSQVLVVNQQYVRKNQLLFRINAEPFQLQVAKAQADLRQVKNQVKAAQAGLIAAKAVVAERQAALNDIKASSNRTLSLFKRGLQSVAANDLAVRQIKVASAALLAAHSELKNAQLKVGAKGNANAQIKAAQDTLAQAQLNLKHTKIYAPSNGYLAKFNLVQGSAVSAYQSLFALIESKHWWINANFKGKDLARIRKGQTAIIKLDMYPDKLFKGKVVSISAGSGAEFSLLPPENASGNWVQVSQRFPVKVIFTQLNSNYPLRMGANATVTVDTTSDHHNA